MKKISTKTVLCASLLSLIFLSQMSYAQQTTEDHAEDAKNLVKWNFAAAFLKNYSFQYERAIGGKTSFALGFRFMPKSHIAFKSELEGVIDDDDTWESIKEFKTSNFAITPEIRFYMGKGVFRGFYIAPFVRYAKYTADLPYTYDINNGAIRDKINLSGSVNTFTGGVLFGAQWKLSKRVFFDWWILGPNYGVSSGSIAGQKNLGTEEQNELRESLKDLDDLPLVKVKSTVDANGAKVDFNGPWAGLRSGLSIGYRF